MDEAAEDISCNIMPEHYPPPTHTHTHTNTHPPLLPHASSLPIPSTHRHEILFFSPDNYFFSIGKKESLQAVLLWPTLWVHVKRNVGIAYTNGLHECARARQNIESEPLWQCGPFLCL